MNFMNTKQCKCKKTHSFESEVIIGKGVINQLPQAVKKFNAKKVFVVADKNTFAAAGEKTCKILEENEIKVFSYIFKKDSLEPNEENVGLAVMNFNSECDAVIGVGSGVINDISKIVANVTGKPYIIVATAPSMDGYASATSSMTVEGLKVSLNSKCADVIIGDTDILCNAPVKMMLAGLGDMIAKYVSICEWRISNLITCEYYCENVAQLVRNSLKKCVDNAEGLLKRDEAAVQSVFEGLVICGASMKFAGISRPASGIEHYFSHIWDMRGVEFGTPVELHGIQCAIGTLLAIKYYEKIKAFVPEKQKAIDYAKNFDFAKWSDALRAFLGKGAEAMIALEEKEQKYDIEKHAQRLETIIEKWNTIVEIMDEELPTPNEIKNILDLIGVPKTMAKIGLDEAVLPMTFKASKDIRDKYVLSRLAWDLGIIEDLYEENKYEINIQNH